MINSKTVNLKKIFTNLLIYIIFILLFIGSGYCLTLQQNNFKLYVLVLALFLSVIVFLLLGQKLSNNALMHSLVMLFSIIITIVINQDFNNSYLVYFILILVSLFFTHTIGFDKFKKIFVNFMVVITIISLTIIFLNLIGIKLPYTLFKSYNDVTYRNYFYVYFQYINNTDAIRNSSIFWESGLFASYLLFALVFLSFDDKKHILKNIILIIGLISTLSLGGYILGLIVIFLNIFKKTKHNRLKQLVSFIFSISVILLVYFAKDYILDVLIGINDNLFSKLKFDDTSSLTRIYSPIIDLKLFFKSPIIGQGLSKFSIMYLDEIGKLSYVDSQTSTFGFMLGVFGIGGIIYVSTIIISIFKSDIGNIFVKILFIILLSLIMNKEPHNALILSWVLIYYFIKGEKNET